MLSLQSTQQLLRALGAHHLSLYMGNRLGYLLMLLWEIRVGDLLLLTLYITPSSLSRRPRIISSESKSTRSATLTSNTAYRSIRWENKCCFLRRHFTWLVLQSFRLGLLHLSGCCSILGKRAYRLDLRGRLKDFHNVFHISQVCKHTPGGSSANPPDPIQVEGQKHFEVEALLQHKSRGSSQVVSCEMVGLWS